MSESKSDSAKVLSSYSSDAEIETLARTFLPDIIAFFESEEGQREYEEWLQQRKGNENVV